MIRTVVDIIPGLFVQYSGDLMRIDYNDVHTDYMDAEEAMQIINVVEWLCSMDERSVSTAMAMFRGVQAKHKEAEFCEGWQGFMEEYQKE